jgi:hypothetical protein
MDEAAPPPIEFRRVNTVLIVTRERRDRKMAVPHDPILAMFEKTLLAVAT